MEEKVLELLEIGKCYEEKVVVDHVSLEISRGEVIGLLGPNGAGKSTIIKMIAGICEPTIGTIKLFGREDNKGLREARRRLGLVPQDLAIYQDLKVWENVELFAGIYGLKGKALSQSIDQVLAFTELTKMRQAYVKTLSEGMKRRLNMACALAHLPEILIFDEPTVAIDPQSRRFILERIKGLNKEGRTIIYTSHYMEEVEKLCNRIAILDQGKMIALGTKEELVQMVAEKGESLSLEEVFIRLTGKTLVNRE